MLALEQRCGAAAKAISAPGSSSNGAPLSEAQLLGRMRHLTTAATAAWAAIAASLARALAATEEFDAEDLQDGAAAGGGTPRDDVGAALQRAERALLLALDVPAGLACAAAAQLHSRAAAAAAADTAAPAGVGAADAVASAAPEAKPDVAGRADELADGEPDLEWMWRRTVEEFRSAWAGLLRGVNALGRLAPQRGGQAPTLARQVADLVDGLPVNAIGLAGLELAAACVGALSTQVSPHSNPHL